MHFKQLTSIHSFSDSAVTYLKIFLILLEISIEFFKQQKLIP